MSDLLLSAKNVRKTYLLGNRSLEVLRGVDVDLHRGEFLALRGASGAGKSTLLHLLGGLDAPNEGEVWLAGRNLAGQTVEHTSVAEETNSRAIEKWGKIPVLCVVPDEPIEGVTLPPGVLAAKSSSFCSPLRMPKKRFRPWCACSGS